MLTLEEALNYSLLIRSDSNLDNTGRYDEIVGIMMEEGRIQLLLLLLDLFNSYKSNTESIKEAIN